MGRLLLVVIVQFLVTPLFAGEVSGTLTLEGEFLVFRAGDMEVKYEVDRVPGLKMFGYTSKIRVKDGVESDVSELEVLLSPNVKFTLIAFQPVLAVRIGEGSSTRWNIGDSLIER